MAKEDKAEKQCWFNSRSQNDDLNLGPCLSWRSPGHDTFYGNELIA